MHVRLSGRKFFQKQGVGRAVAELKTVVGRKKQRKPVQRPEGFTGALATENSSRNRALEGL